MTPEQEFAKQRAEETAARNYELGRCFACNGVAYSVDSGGAVLKCSVCGGTGQQMQAKEQ